MPFSTLLVANRGEVALRLVRAARRLGLRTVAIYSDADASSPHVREADRAVRVGPPPAAESYLCIEAVLAAAKESGAGAVHPGYGFLSENAAFAEACESAGLVFVGPQPGVIDLMSRKDRAREAAARAGAPVLPALGPQGLAPATQEALQEVARVVGFPALVKAVAGGGGKGMRLVASARELGQALEVASNEAFASFGDASVFVERYLAYARHLEVQVAGDGTGNVVHFFDRDCSVQRRHQKVLEEAPASTCSAAARSKALDAALRIARSVSYRSLGTVEFVVAGDDVYFLEMNTRLQVEHAVTEAVTGVDLVELQLRLALGEPLRLRQQDVEVCGHAMEARIYAEDAGAGFLPQTGRVLMSHWPPTARVETALEEGQEVTDFYDAMVAKVVVVGPDRQAARQKLVDALDRTAILGLTTNAGFLRRLAASEAFGRAALTTSSLDGGEAAWFAPAADAWRAPLAAAAVSVAEKRRRASAADPFGADGWRLGAPPAPVRIAFSAGKESYEVLVHRSEGCFSVEGTGPELRLRAAQQEGAMLLAEVDGQTEPFFLLEKPGEVLVAHRGEQYCFTLGVGGGRSTSQLDGTVVAPLPGILVSVGVSAGDRVQRGDVLGVLESMKMQYQLRAPVAARVERVAFGPGAHVSRGELLFELQEEVRT
jgi:3-methylcrotonyl-CoA carboxylase alpha subunit/acetyl-CoA/propionyl-CoA carboxylase biotin carboxyl carrier protein